MSSNSSSKCPKNLGIVMESADEGQALLTSQTAPSADEESENRKTIERCNFGIGCIEPSGQQQSDAGSSNQVTKMRPAEVVIDENTDKVVFKGRRKGIQPSRMERSRLSLITFLNNITAPSTRFEHGKSSRSQSMSSTNIVTPNPAFPASSPPHIEPVEQSARLTCSVEKAHRPTKSLGGKSTNESAQQQKIQNAFSIGNLSAVSNQLPSTGGEVSPIGSAKGNVIGVSVSVPVNASLADKLSIKSGASSTSSGHSESQSNLSSGKFAKARECPVCCIRQHPSNFHKLKTCCHLTCKSCLLKYLNLEIMESRTNISCPNCTVQLHASDIYILLEHQPELLDRYEMFALRRALSADPDARWCPAPDCTYAVIAYSCAACPQLKCERCETMFCYHCKNNWHPNQTCDQARARFGGHGIARGTHQASSIVTDTSGVADVTKACPRCGVQIMKMNDGSCNHMQCVLCNAEFCWLCLKQINELHYLSPTGCTFWGKKPWTRKKKLLWQIGTLIGAPLGIALIAGLAVPGIICGVPIFVGRKTYQRFSNLSKTKRQFVTALSVLGSLIISPVLAVMTVGVGVPIMLAYVYGVVPLSLCRNGACGGSSNKEGTNCVSDDETAYGDEVEASNTVDPQHIRRKMRHHREDEKASNKSSFHHRRQSIASSGLVSLTDKPNTEDASIQAIAGSQYNYDNRSVHTVWSSGQYGVQLGAVEFAQEATSYNNEDAENSSTLACCSASIVAQASERRSLTDSNGSFRNARPRSSISNRGISEDTGKASGKISHKIVRNNTEMCKSIGVEGAQKFHAVRRSSSPFVRLSNPALPDRMQPQHTTHVSSTSSRSRLSFRSFLRHPVNSIFGTKSASPKN